MKKHYMIVVWCLVISSLAQCSAVSNRDRAIVTAKLLCAGGLAALATVGMDKLSPEISKGAVVTVLGASTLLASRIICRGDINTTEKAISLPLAGKWLPELNWFNTISFGFGLAGYGLYKNSDKLALALKHIIEAAATAQPASSI